MGEARPDKIRKQTLDHLGNNIFCSVQTSTIREVRQKSGCMCFLMHLELFGSRRKGGEMRKLGLGKAL